jgi:dTDP-4-amino-4,6-dideoxygalactose transaminase
LSHDLAVVVLDTSVRRDEVQAFLRHRGIHTSMYYPAIHQFSAFVTSAGARGALQVIEVVDAQLAARISD